jgi:hypothetical protein
MGPRTFVSFEAAASKEGEPPGRELAQAVAAALSRHGVDVHGPDEHEGWAWALETSFDGGDIFCLLGLTDDPPMEWQLHSYAQRSRSRLLGGAKVEQLDAQMTNWLLALAAALREIDGVRSIRWYDEAIFNGDHGATWFESPLD